MKLATCFQRNFLFPVTVLGVWVSFVCAVFAQGPAGGIAAIDPLVNSAIEARQMPGAVVMIGTSDEILHFKAYGQRQLVPDMEPMTTDTIFDLASLTKPIATGLSVMLLVEQGKIDPAAPVSKYLPEFAENGKESVTVEQLLIHTSGLIADNSLEDYRHGREEAWRKICRLKLKTPPGEKFVYSDVGFITLGFLVEKISSQPENEFASQHLFARLNLKETSYLPDAKLIPRIAPTQMMGDRCLRGTVHDPRCEAMGGVAGHAGLFSSAEELNRIARMILNHGELDGVRILKPETVAAMLVSRPVGEDQFRTWGWDRQTGFSINRGIGMSEQAIGHGGFTGTGIWIDPGLDVYVIFLSNRVHPDGKGRVNQLIGEIGTAAVEFQQSKNSVQ